MAIIKAANELKDKYWIRQAFFSPKRFGGAGQQVTKAFTTAEMKYYDTTPGGNKSINPKSQFTRYADPKAPSLAVGSKGMGHYYSEAYDDAATRISLRFGVPAYNPLSRFLSGYFDRSLAQLVNTGEVRDGLFSTYTLGKVLATIYTLPLQVYFGVSYLFTRVDSVLTGRPYSKYYYMDPTMPLYWSAVNTLVNQVAVNMGLVHGYQANDLSGTEGDASPENGLSSDDVRALNRILPDVFKSDTESVIDVKSMSARAQRLQNQYHAVLDEIARDESLDAEGYAATVQAKLRTNSLSARTTDYGDLNSYLNAYQASPMGTAKENNSITPVIDGEQQEQLTAEAIRTEEPGLKDLMLAELREGSAFVTFEVDYNGSIGESFSNSTKESGLAEQINSAASSMRDTFVNFAGGNVGDGLIGGAAEAAIGAVKGLLAGVAEKIGFGGLASLGGAGFVDIPEVWDNATADLPSESYTIRLSTPYGNKMSIFTKIIIPMMCLLAGALPRSTGKSSYGAPFLCSLHSQGRNDIKLGIIDTISIERGTSNIGFNVDGLPTAVDITFTVKNLNSIMHVPISDSLLDTVTSFSFFDEDTALSDYLSTISGLDLYSQFYMAPRIKLAWSKTTANWDSFTSPSYFAQWAASTGPGTLVSGILESSSNLRGL